MSLHSREDSLAGIRRREALATKVATAAVLAGGSIVLTLPAGGVIDGTMVKFRAPCAGTAVTGGISIDGVTYTVVDAMHSVFSGKDGVWDTGAEIAVLLDTGERKAYLQNASTAGLMATLDDHEARILRLEDFLFNDITGNPHSITFTNLTGLVVTRVWNKSKARLEC